MAVSEITIQADISEMQGPLAEAFEIVGNLRERGVDIPGCPLEAVEIDSDTNTTLAGECLVRIKPSQSFLDWLSALRTLERDCLGHQ